MVRWSACLVAALAASCSGSRPAQAPADARLEEFRSLRAAETSSAGDVKWTRAAGVAPERSFAEIDPNSALVGVHGDVFEGWLQTLGLVVR
jgi:hypothetical protein